MLFQNTFSFVHFKVILFPRKAPEDAVFFSILLKWRKKLREKPCETDELSFAQEASPCLFLFKTWSRGSLTRGKKCANKDDEPL